MERSTWLLSLIHIWIVKPGNPLSIGNISDITPEVRYINRQRGAGTRVLFDYLLKKEGIPTKNIRGYEHEAATHMSVAVAVQKDNADVGMGIYSCLLYTSRCV